jgi:hypothetical protein
MARKGRNKDKDLPETEANVVSNPEPQEEPEQAVIAEARSFVARSRSGKYESDPDLKGRVPDDILYLYECHQWKHAAAILATGFPDELNDIISVL